MSNQLCKIFNLLCVSQLRIVDPQLNLHVSEQKILPTKTRRQKKTGAWSSPFPLRQKPKVKTSCSAPPRSNSIDHPKKA